jgi:6-phosphogluconolactonase (cycloisomerase 2 family)
VRLKYFSGSVTFIPILSALTSDMVQFGEPVTVQLKYKELAGRNPVRQDGPHAHEAVLHPTTGELLVPDLGADKLCRFKKTDSGKWQSGSGVDIQYETGGGPRHILFYSIYIQSFILMSWN